MDQQIITLLQKRDESGLQMLRDAYGGLCIRLALQITGSRRDAEECLSDALFDVWNQIPPDCPEYLRAYLLTIVRRHAIRRVTRENAAKRGGTQLSAALEELGEILPAGENVEQTVDSRALADCLHQFLSELPEMQRKAMLLRYYAALPTAEIAQRLGVTDGRVRMMLTRTRRALQDHLRKEGFL